ncbi:hypothetical protein HY389_02230 [Candidatus Daviesbacteria bacterium]|nr:hypothetical protein [Candidatus Daviesbacteria bacterium]
MPLLKTAKVVGLNSDLRAAQALVVEAPVSFFAIASCSCDDAFSRSRQALTGGEDSFYSSSENLAQRLPNVLQIITSSLIGCDDIQVLLGACSDGVLYLISSSTNLRAYLLRGGRYNNLLSSAAANQLISGFLEPEDKVVLTTPSLIELLEEDLRKLDQMPIEAFEDEINALLPEARVDPLAVVMVSVLPKPKETIIKSLDNLAVKDESLQSPRAVLNPNLKTMVAGVKSMLPNFRRRLVAVGIILLLVAVGIIYSSRKPLQIASTQQNQDQKNPTGSPASTSQTFQVKDFPTWLDLNLVKQGLSAQQLSLSLGNLLILDLDKKTLVEINLAKKSNQLLAGVGDLGDARHSSLNGQLAFVYSQDKGVVRIDTGSQKVTQAVKPDSGWGKIADIDAFAGNVYLLDSLQSQIYKYLPVASGYSDKRSYFASGTKPDLAGASRMQIDGSVWVLKNNQLFKYTQGSEDFFSVSGLDRGIQQAKSFFVSDETDNVYVLDSGNSRLLVFDKKGIFKAQYVGDKFKDSTDLVIDEADKKIYLLSGSKIYQIDLK